MEETKAQPTVVDLHETLRSTAADALEVVIYLKCCSFVTAFTAGSTSIYFQKDIITMPVDIDG